MDAVSCIAMLRGQKTAAESPRAAYPSRKTEQTGDGNRPERGVIGRLLFPGLLLSANSCARRTLSSHASTSKGSAYGGLQINAEVGWRNVWAPKKKHPRGIDVCLRGVFCFVGADPWARQPAILFAQLSNTSSTCRQVRPFRSSLPYLAWLPERLTSCILRTIPDSSRE